MKQKSIEKPIEWLGSSLKDIQAMPDEVRQEFGFSLYQLQQGLNPDNAKSLKGISGVYELLADFNKDTYRTVYIAKLNDTIYVLHCFKKKSKKGIATPKQDVDLIKTRLKELKGDIKK